MGQTSETGGFGISFYSVNRFDASTFDIILSECNDLYDLPHRIQTWWFSGESFEEEAFANFYIFAVHYCVCMLKCPVVLLL